MPTNACKPPTYHLHAASGRARVKIDGRHFYLGDYDSPESRERYDDLIREWRLKQSTDGYTITVDPTGLLFDLQPQRAANVWFPVVSGKNLALSFSLEMAARNHSDCRGNRRHFSLLYAEYR